MKNKKVQIIFLLLILYIVTQSVWWMYNLYNLSGQLFSEDVLKGKITMIFGEGVVFLIILVFSFLLTLKSIKKELALSKQQKNFLMSVTHELKTPIASIKLYLQTLLKHDIEKKKRDDILEKSIIDTNRLNSLLETILLATKIDDHSHVLNKEEFNFSNLLQETCFKLLETSKKEIDVEFLIEDDILFSGDKEAIISIINNLIDNAIKYSPNKSTITVSLSKTETTTTLSVKDQGNGIPTAEKSKIFSKFYRIGDENTRKEQGTGLGLFIVKYLTEQHNGTVQVQKNQPKGAIFVCEFAH